MKLKYYLRGLGIGIICTAIIMGIALSGNKKETMTDTEIIERARLLGMVMPEEAEEPSEAEDGQKQPEDKKSKPEEPENGKSQDLTTDKTSDGSKTDSQTAGGNEADAQKTDESKAGENNAEDSSDKNQSVNKPDSSQETVQFEIKSGEYSDTISRKLFQAGLISDAEAFNKYLTQKGADQNLRVGVYEIPIGSTQDEIIAIFQK